MCLKERDLDWIIGNSLHDLEYNGSFPQRDSYGCVNTRFGYSFLNNHSGSILF